MQQKTIWKWLTMLLLGGASGQVAQAQFNKVQGTYVVIETDAPVSPAVSELAEVFDLAVPQWCAFFGVPIVSPEDFRVQAYLMNVRERFASTGRLPSSLPNFAHGFQRGNDVWVMNQPSDYYTRHLLLHEGVHAIMSHLFGGAGPAWFMEGTAELLATHRWKNRQLVLPMMPESKQSVPYWGRIKLLRTAREKGEVLSVDAIMNYSQKAHQKVEPYAWSWALLVLLNQYPEYRQLVVTQARSGHLPYVQFTTSFREKLSSESTNLSTRWKLLLADLDYGYDLPRNKIELPDAKSMDSQPKTISVRADRGWQSTGLLLQEGQQLTMTAEGRFSLAKEPRPWISEADGVTLEYYRGRPLGMLLAAIVPVNSRRSMFTSMPQIEGVGSKASVTSKSSGLLLLRIGDHPGLLNDNQGELKITIRQAK